MTSVVGPPPRRALAEGRTLRASAPEVSKRGQTLAVTHPALGVTKARRSGGRKGESCHPFLRRCFSSLPVWLGRSHSRSARTSCAFIPRRRRRSCGPSSADGVLASSFVARWSSVHTSSTSWRPLRAWLWRWTVTIITPGGSVRTAAAMPSSSGRVCGAAAASVVRDQSVG